MSNYTITQSNDSSSAHLPVGGTVDDVDSIAEGDLEIVLKEGLSDGWIDSDVVLLTTSTGVVWIEYEMTLDSVGSGPSPECS